MSPTLRPVRDTAHPPAMLTNAEVRLVDHLIELALDAWERDQQRPANGAPHEKREAG